MTAYRNYGISLSYRFGAKVSLQTSPEDIFYVPRHWSPETHGTRCFFYDVFVSHASGDRSEDLVNALRAHDVRVWYDKTQAMDDRLWATRIIWGLTRSRSVLVTVSGVPLLDHKWVRTEALAARAPSLATGIPRLFVAQISQSVIPEWLQACEVILSAPDGVLDPAEVSIAATRLRDLNHISVSTTPPPWPRLLAHPARCAGPNTTTAIPEIDEHDVLGWLTAWVWQIIRYVRAFGDKPAPHKAHTLMYYHMRLESDKLWPPREKLAEATSDRAQRLAEDLEMVASVPGLTTDTRYAAHLVLERLAHAGVIRAWQVLRACLSWEWDSTIVSEIVKSLKDSPESMGREDAILSILKGDLQDDKTWPLHFLDERADPVRLLHYVRTQTASEVRRLPKDKSAQELAARMAVAASEVSSSNVELVLREAIAASGLDSDGCGRFRVTGALLQAESAAMLVSLIFQCAREWPVERRVELWQLRFERLVAAPLRTLDHLLPNATDGVEALEAFVSCMETPLLECERLFHDNPTLSDGTVGMLASVRLAQYRATVDALRQKANVVEEGDWIAVDVFGDDFRRHADQLAEEAQHLEYRLEGELAKGGALVAASQPARLVLERWAHIPTS